MLVLEKSNKLWYETLSRLTVSTESLSVPMLLSTLRKIFGDESKTVAYHMGYWLAKGSKGLENIHKASEKASKLLGIPHTVI